MTKPTYTPRYVASILPAGGLPEHKLYDSVLATLRDEAQWDDTHDAPRSECFMAEDQGAVYSYGSQARGRTYKATPMHPLVKAIMDGMNADLKTAYNVCVLNRYKDGHQHLGWHCDDSPEQDKDHPIAVVSFGAERAIWTRVNGHKGPIPDEDKYLLGQGSLFVMPVGYQDTHQHKIPKHDRECGMRISLTFRKLDVLVPMLGAG